MNNGIHIFWEIVSFLGDFVHWRLTVWAIIYKEKKTFNSKVYVKRGKKMTEEDSIFLHTFLA